MPYGKALSTYRRINNIRRASENISQAKNMILEQQGKAMEKLNEVQTRGAMFNSGAQLLTELVGMGAVRSKKINPEQAKAITAGVGTLSSIGATAASGAFGMRDSHMAGLGQRGAMEFTSSIRNPAEAGIHGYGFADSLSENQRMKAVSDYIKEQGGENLYGLTENQLRTHAGEVEWKKGVGWDTTNLSSNVARAIYNMRVASGHEDPLDPEDNDQLKNYFKRK